MIKSARLHAILALAFSFGKILAGETALIPRIAKTVHRVAVTDKMTTPIRLGAFSGPVMSALNWTFWKPDYALQPPVSISTSFFTYGRKAVDETEVFPRQSESVHTLVAMGKMTDSLRLGRFPEPKIPMLKWAFWEPDYALKSPAAALTMAFSFGRMLIGETEVFPRQTESVHTLVAMDKMTVSIRFDRFPGPAVPKLKWTFWKPDYTFKSLLNRLPPKDVPFHHHPGVLPVSSKITHDDAESLVSKIVFEGLMDGSLNPRSPEWRPYLAQMLEMRETRDPDAIFSLILTGCAGNAEPARITLAQKWAKDYEGGRFSGAVDLFVARRFFFSDNYQEAIRRAGLVAANHPEQAVKALLLSALAEAQGGLISTASKTVKDILEKYPDSPEIPEARYMEAWLALQYWRTEDAIKMLKAIIADYPQTPTAAKAAQMLINLEAQ